MHRHHWGLVLLKVTGVQTDRRVGDVLPSARVLSFPVPFRLHWLSPGGAVEAKHVFLAPVRSCCHSDKPIKALMNMWPDRTGKERMATFNRSHLMKNKESADTTLLIVPFISRTIMKIIIKKTGSPRLFTIFFFLK